MIVICATVVPLFHKAKVYTAYEYLEKRFDSKTRTLASVIFLCQRGLSAGLTLYAPAIVLSVILGWPEQTTTMLMGALVITYTVLGGIKAVQWSDVQQMGIIFLGLVMSLVAVIVLMPPSVSFGDAMFLAGKAGRLNAVTTHFDWNDRFNIWSGLIGSTFLFLSYFGCDQSQVQRYLTGRSIAQSSWACCSPPWPRTPCSSSFCSSAPWCLSCTCSCSRRFCSSARTRPHRTGGCIPARGGAIRPGVRGPAPGGAGAGGSAPRARFRRRGRRSRNTARRRSRSTARHRGREAGGVDRRRKRFQRHQLHLSFVRHAPSAGGIVGLIIAVIFAAAMSASSGEINSLATVTVVDIYRRYIRREASDHHYLAASRWATLFWGIYAVTFGAGWGKRLGSR